ncbi:MAG: hypothetical protein MJ171_02845 [Clostridia bacterium]|nr:hypothetical protein [Clostridia bacterium]
MTNFWDSSVWGFIALMAVLGITLLFANLLKKQFRFLKQSLIPTSVLGGIILLIIAVIYQNITGNVMFNENLFGGNGQATLELLTYHCLALGFISSTYRSASAKFGKKRTVEIIDSGVTTVSGYLIQAIFGLGITILIALVVKDFFSASGIILPFGYGQGTGQAMNYGNIYETDYGFVGGKTFGLSIAACGFLSAAIGGVIHLNIMKKRGQYKFNDEDIIEALNSEQIESKDEVPMNGSIDKMSIQVSIVFATYLLAYFAIYFLASLVPGFQSILYGFNFLFGVLFATLVKKVLSSLNKKGVVKKQYVNSFLMNRICGLCFDIMIITGIAAIRIEFLKDTWWALLILAVVGAVVTYLYLRVACKTVFKDCVEEQFLCWYGMLTGTASTGMILLREVDPEFKTHAADNLVYQNFPAIALGFPMMIVATMCPKMPVITWLICLAYFVVLQVYLFRKSIFKKKSK